MSIERLRPHFNRIIAKWREALKLVQHRIAYIIIVLLLVSCTFQSILLLSIWYQAAIRTFYIKFLLKDDIPWEANISFNRLFSWEPLLDFILFHTIAILVSVIWLYFLYRLVLLREKIVPLFLRIVSVLRVILQLRVKIT